MAIKKVTQAGQAVIRRKAKPVAMSISKVTKRLVKDLIDTMRAANLIGIAAPQIGKSLRVIVTEIRATKLRKGEKNMVDSLRVFINPKIVSVSKKQALGWEGCGSIAFGKLFGKVRRPVSVTVRALDRQGKPFELSATNLLARVIQHEVDHLNGILFTDTADPATFISSTEYKRLRKKK